MLCAARGLLIVCAVLCAVLCAACVCVSDCSRGPRHLAHCVLCSGVLRVACSDRGCASQGIKADLRSAEEELVSASKARKAAMAKAEELAGQVAELEAALKATKAVVAVADQATLEKWGDEVRRRLPLP